MKKLKPTLLLIALFIITYVHAQTVTNFVSSGIVKPVDITFDKYDTMYVSEGNITCDLFSGCQGGSIKKISKNGAIFNFVDTGFFYPTGIALDRNNNLFVVNYDTFYYSYIDKITSNGNISKFGKNCIAGGFGIALDTSGNMYVSSGGFNYPSVTKVGSNGKCTFGNFANSGLSSPTGLAFDSKGNLYVANQGNNTISKITSTGNVSTFVNTGLDRPYGLAFDKFGNLYVTNHGNNSISKVSTSGVVTSLITSGLYLPSGLAFDQFGNLYVANQGNNTIVKVTSISSLPIDLLAFNLKLIGRTVLVSWKTSINSAKRKFILQRSTNGSFFIDLDTVQTEAKIDNNFEFIDKTPSIGINYYRLLSVERNGDRNYSKVVSIKLESKQLFSITPNPSRDFTNISFNNPLGKAILTVYDLTGKAVITKFVEIGTKNYQMNTQTLTNGLYMIKVITETSSENQKLVIAK